MFGFLKMLVIGAILSIASTISAQAFTSKCTNPIECRCDQIDPLKLQKADWDFWYDDCVTVNDEDEFTRPDNGDEPKKKKYGKHHGKKYGKHHGGKKKYGKRGGHKKYGKKGGHKKGGGDWNGDRNGDWNNDNNDNPTM